MNISITQYFLLFIIYSFCGWLLEVTCKLIEYKRFINRGFLIGPYCPIYGWGAVAITFLLYKYSYDPLILFMMTIVTCAILEYLTSLVMEKLFKARWWDYSKYKYNLNGRICLQNSLLFGVLGVVLIKFINPHVFNFICSLSPKLINILFYSVLTIYICDFFVSFKVVMKVKNMSIKYVNLDNTKEITEKIKSILNDKLLTRRIIKAFPNIKFNIKKAVENLKEKFEQS